MKETYDMNVIQKLGVLSERVIQREPWVLECNIISWNGKQPKLDIRSWDKKTHNFMSKGITLTRAEALKLAEIITKNFAQQ